MAYALHWLATDPLQMLGVESRAKLRRFNAPRKRTSSYFSLRAQAELVLSRARAWTDTWPESTADAAQLLQAVHWSDGGWREEWEDDWFSTSWSNFYEWHQEDVLALGPVDNWNNYFVQTFREWTSDAKTIPQGQFWHFVEALTASSSSQDLITCEGKSSRDFLLVPHHGRWQQSKVSADLSGRRIRHILVQLAKELERIDFDQLDGSHDLGKYLSILRRSLICKVLAFVRCKIEWRHNVYATTCPQTRDLVRVFVIHTGVSPPTLAVNDPIDSRMMSANAKSRRGSNVKNRRRETTRNLRNPLYYRRSEARCRHGPQDNALAGRSSRPAGCRRLGSHLAMAQGI
jgi:hypothetical protein